MNFSQTEKQILKLINKQNGISRKALADFSNLSRASITNITKNLLENDYIIEGDRVSQGLGRKEVLLYSNPEKYKFLGIDLGGYRIRLALSNNNLEILHKDDCLMSELEGEEDKGKGLIQIINNFIDKTGIQKNSIHAAGVGVTGIVDPHQQTILNIPNAENWDNIPIVKRLMESFGYPSFLDEGGRTMALAEKMLGKARLERDFMVVHVGYGLVAGIMINDQILRGADNVSNLLGHITVDESAGRCKCGNYGCLENIITFPMLEINYKERGGKKESIISGYLKNEKVALDVCISAGKALGIALSNVVNLFNPRSIYLGGAIFDHLPLLFEETKRTITLRGNRFATLHLNLDRTSFESHQGIIGALALAKTRFLEEI